MTRKKITTQKPFELTMLDDSLTKLEKIGNRQPLPNRHFYKEASEIMRAAVVASYNAGVVDGAAKSNTFPVDEYDDMKTRK